MLGTTEPVNTPREFAKLEAALMQAGKDIEYPSVPRIALRVHARLEAAPRARWTWLPRHAWSLAFAILFAIALLLAVPETRNAIAQLLGLRSVQIISVTPTATLTVTPTLRANDTPRPTLPPSPTPRAQCCVTTLADAQTLAKFKLLLPPDQQPSRVYLQNVFGADYQQAILVFGDPRAPTFTLYEAHNVVYEKLVNFGKGVGPGTIIEETTVNGSRALWLTGEPHVLVHLSPSGEPIAETQRVVDANTLAWESVAQGVTYRLETKQDMDAAVRFAESLQ